jgi:hypothetical protein
LDWSNEAFEVWYIWHFLYRDTALPRKDHESILTAQMRRKNILKTNERYTEIIQDMYGKLLRLQQTAIDNSKRPRERQSEEQVHPYDANLSTTVHELVIELNKNSRLQSKVSRTIERGLPVKFSP